MMGDSPDHETFDLRDSEDAWEEIYDEPVQTYVGGIRNYHYKGAGQIILSRPLFVWLKEDQASIALSQPQTKIVDISPGVPPVYNFESSLSHVGQLPAAHFTRFLEILPGSEGTVECHLHVASIASMAGCFEALSYASPKAAHLGTLSFIGPPTEPNTIGSTTIDCRQDLVQFLRKLRLPDRRRLVWCPHLCINLDSYEERKEYTRMASRIYGLAHQVLVWLGEDSFKDPGKGFASMCKVVNTWRSRSDLLTQIDEADYHFNPGSSPFGGPQAQKPPAPSFEEAWSTLIGFFEKPWFKGIWSLLEVGSAKRATVMLGDEEISWEWVGLSASILRENYCRPRSIWHSTWPQGRQPVVPQEILNAALMHRLCRSQSYFKHATLRFDQLYPLTARFSCKVEQDRVHVLLGLASDNAELLANVPIDYEKSPAQHRYNIGNALLESGHINFLARIQQDHGKRHLKHGDLDSGNIMLDGPSWCPQKVIAMHEPILPIQLHADFSASTGSCLKLEIESDGRVLRLSAVVVDKIITVTRLDRIVYFWRGTQPDRDRHTTESTALFPQAPGGFCDLMSKDELEALDKSLRPGVTEADLQLMATTLTCGKDWYGSPISDVKRHTADYARSILRGGPRWSLCWAVNLRAGIPINRSESFLSVDDLLKISKGGHADRFLDAAATVGYGRASFETEKGLWGIGPDVMAQGDQLCTISGVGVPFIIRPQPSGHHLLVGECYVFNMMHGEVDDSLEAGVDGLEETTIRLD